MVFSPKLRPECLKAAFTQRGPWQYRNITRLLEQSRRAHSGSEAVSKSDSRVRNGPWVPLLSAIVGGTVVGVLVLGKDANASVNGSGNSRSSSFGGRATWQYLHDGIPEFKALNLQEADQRLVESNDAKDDYMPVMPIPTHTKQVASNQPVEDTVVKGLIEAKDRTYQVWGVFDGHAGWATAWALREQLIPWLTMHISSIVPGQSVSSELPTFSSTLVSALKNSFLSFDQDLQLQALESLNVAKNSTGNVLASAFASQAAYSAGSCALVCMYDPKDSTLYTACTGDSRAILIRPTSESTGIATPKYTAVALSIDQNGFNKDEVARVEAAHPGEKPFAGPRLLGIMITRAFGDARWKLGKEELKAINEDYAGPVPRSGADSPPYLTAEPEVTVTQIRKGDILVMGSDGLWDHMSNDAAAEVLEVWMERYAASAAKKSTSTSTLPDRSKGGDDFNTAAMDAGNAESLEYNFPTKLPHESTWQVSSKDIVAEDDNAATSLIRNSFGGKRRGLFQAVMSAAPPLRRNFVDDISVHVVFF